MSAAEWRIKKTTLILLSVAMLITGCGGKHGKEATVYPAVPATACGVATVAATALSPDVRFIDPVNVSSAGGLSEHPSIAVGDSGRVYVAWDDDKNLNKDIFFRRSDDYGGTYQPTAASAINVSKTGTATIPVMGVANNGTIHVAWQDVSRGPSEIFYARSTDGGVTFANASQVSSVNVLGDTTTQALGVFLAIDHASGVSGNIYLAWSESTSSGGLLQLARSTDGGARFSIVNTYIPVGMGASTTTVALAVDNGGNLHLAWAESLIESGITIRKMRYTKSTDAGATFLPATPIELARGNTVVSPTVATDGNWVYVAWRNEDDKHIHFAASSDGGISFGTEFSIVPNSGRSISPRLATGPDGTLYMSWTDNSAGNYDTYYSKSTDHGSTFTTPVNFAPSAQGSLFTAITVDKESNIYIAWDDNRYSNPPDTPEAIGNEGNFEILLARGKLGLPAVQDALAAPCPVTPNGDNNADTTNITAHFSELLNWTLNIFASDGSSVFQQAGSGTEIGTTWDGSNQGAVVADGLYTYSISGHNSSGVASTTATGSIDLYTTAADAAPAIVVTDVVTVSGVVQTSTFQREAFAFSPNGDGFKDSDGISAHFNKPVNWVIQIKDSGGTVQRTLRGSGIILDSNVTRWDGKDEAGNIVPEGAYNVGITITDGQGLSASCGRQPVPCLTMEIDTTRPSVLNALLTPPDASNPPVYNPAAGSAVISGTPTELSLITIYIYNQVGVLIRKVDRNFRDVGVPFSVSWDGKDSNGQAVTPGNYEVYMWCRDRAGNTAATYPIQLGFTVQ